MLSAQHKREMLQKNWKSTKAWTYCGGSFLFSYVLNTTSSSQMTCCTAFCLCFPVMLWAWDVCSLGTFRSSAWPDCFKKWLWSSFSLTIL